MKTYQNQTYKKSNKMILALLRIIWPARWFMMFLSSLCLTSAYTFNLIKKVDQNLIMF